MQQKLKPHRAAFTLIELLVVVGLGVALGVAGITYGDFFVSHKNVDQAVREIEAVLSDTRRRSIAGELGTSWGVFFENGTSGPVFSIFSGSSFASGTVRKSVRLPFRTQFLSPSMNDDLEILFSSVSGEVAESAVISIAPKRPDNYVGIISINSKGRVVSSLEEDIVGIWKFDDEGAFATADLTGLTGSLVGDSAVGNPGEVPLQWASGAECKVGSCIRLNNYFLVGNPADKVYDSMSVESWVKLMGNGNYGSVYSGISGGSEIVTARFQASSRKPQFRVLGSTVSDDDAFSLDEWHHLVYVYAEGMLTIYLDGSEVASQSGVAAELNIQEFEVGRSDLRDNYLLDGYLDELRLYPQALSPEEVLARYNSY